MHPITRKDRLKLLKYNLKNNFFHTIRAFNEMENSGYFLSWINGNKIYLRKKKTDILVFKKIFLDREYDFLFPDNIRTVIDAGANIGLSSIFFALKFPKARIIALEPEESNFELLQQNVMPYKNIYPLLGGINNTSGAFGIKNKNGDHWNFMLESLSEEYGDGRFYTIHEIMKLFKMETIDYLKIDIEGGEELLFKSDYDWLKKVRTLSIELHDFILPRSSNPFFKAIVEYQPFSFINYGENHFIEFQ